MIANIVYTCSCCGHDFYFGFLKEFEGYCPNMECRKLISLNGGDGAEILRRKIMQKRSYLAKK
jgi:hypothetical protein